MRPPWKTGWRSCPANAQKQGPLSDPSPLERRVERMLSGYQEYLEQDVQFDDSTCRRLLDRCGVPPAVLSPEVLHRLIDQALLTPTTRGASRRVQSFDFTNI